MPIMTWDQSLDVHVDAMNREHKDILDAMNRIYDADARGQTGPAIMAMIGELGRITVKHFQDEEAFMASIKFPDLDRHKLVHARLLTNFTEHVGKIDAAGGKASQDFFNFLRYWLSAHIRGLDIKYGEHAKGPKAGKVA